MTSGRTVVLGLLAFAVSWAGGATGLELREGFRAECRVQEANGRGKVLLLVTNDVGRDVYLFGVTPSPLRITPSGTASVEVLTLPHFRRVLSPGNHLTFRWTVDFNGCGTVNIANSVTAEDPDGVSITTGLVDCGTVVVDGPECADPTPTRTPRLVFTPRPTRTPFPTFTRRPTFTPRPTRTPRPPVGLLPTRTPVPTRTRIPGNPTKTPRPTRTPRQPLPTRTPTPTPQVNPGGAQVHCNIQEANGRGKVLVLFENDTGGTLSNVSADPLVFFESRSGPRLSAHQDGHLEMVVLTEPRARRSIVDGNHVRFQYGVAFDGCGSGQVFASVSFTTPDGTQMNTGRVSCGAVDVACVAATPTRTPRVTFTPRPTRTPFPTFTVRPTRTPIPSATATATPEILVDRALSSCTVRQQGDRLTVFFNVVNDTNGLITDLVAGPLVTEPISGDPAIQILSGPGPRVYSRVRNATSVSFRWSAQITSPGTALLLASARGVAENGEIVDLGPEECGVVELAPPPPEPFDPNGFTGRCIILPAHGFIVNVDFTVTNNTGATLTNLVPAPIELDPTGTVVVEDLVGPQPDSWRKLTNPHTVRFRWRMRPTGEGQLFTHVRVDATGPNGEHVSTGRIQCNTLNVPPRITR